MQKKSLVITIISAVVVIGLMITGGVLLFAPKASNSTPLPSSTGQVTQAPSGPTSVPTINPTATPTTSPEDAQKEVEKSKAFDAANAVAGFTKEDVQKILGESVDYAYNSIANPYFVSGQWMKDGGNTATLDAAVGSFFTRDIRDKILKFNTDPKTSTSLGTDVFPLVFFVQPNGNITASPACSTDSKVASKEKVSCPVDGVKISDMKYTPTLSGANQADPSVLVEFTATAKIPVKVDGNKDGYTTVTYTYKLNFVRNVVLDEIRNPKPFVINDYQVNIDMSKVEVLP